LPPSWRYILSRLGLCPTGDGSTTTMPQSNRAGFSSSNSWNHWYIARWENPIKRPFDIIPYSHSGFIVHKDTISSTSATTSGESEWQCHHSRRHVVQFCISRTITFRQWHCVSNPKILAVWHASRDNQLRWLTRTAPDSTSTLDPLFQDYSASSSSCNIHIMVRTNFRPTLKSTADQMLWLTTTTTEQHAKWNHHRRYSAASM
jgi:hypothetical protein